MVTIGSATLINSQSSIALAKHYPLLDSYFLNALSPIYMR